MADATFQPKVYEDNGGDRLNVVSGGTLSVEAGATEAHANAPAFTGGVVEGAAGAAAAAAMSIVRIVKSLTAMADNTAIDLATVTVPNANHVGGVGVEVVGALGDQDSAEVSYWTVAISRIAGAATKAVVSAKSSNANTAGATANAAVTISVSANTGANGATQTFTIQAKVARSAGAATNHDLVAALELLNIKTTGMTIA